MRSIQFPTIMDLARLLLAFTAVKTVYLEDVQTVLDTPVEGSPSRLLKQRFNERFKELLNFELVPWKKTILDGVDALVELEEYWDGQGKPIFTDA